jgi:alcohol dehydrogenase class IV
LARAVELWAFERVRALPASTTLVWATSSVAERARRELPFAQWSPDRALPESARHLVALGGGTLLDEAKRFVHDEAAQLTLIAIPSIWGSGAENSPVVVLNRGAAKDIRLDDAYLPHARAIWSELAATITPERARDACGDAWAHALEGFLSPIATPELRREAAAIMRAMLEAGVGNDPRWFELSARAANAQARSSVGLIHGIAHTLEPVLGRGHAELCATYMLPVLDFDRRTGKVAALFAEHSLDENAIIEAARALFVAERYRDALPVLETEWRTVLRDRCTRTNAALVRPVDLQFFLDFVP